MKLTITTLLLGATCLHSFAQSALTSATITNGATNGATSYTVGSTTYNYGQNPNGNVSVSEFSTSSGTYELFPVNVQSNFRRNNNANTGFNREIVFYQNNFNGAGADSLQSDHVTSMGSALLSNVISRGSDNVFQNTSTSNTNNIERIDVTFSDDVSLVPQSATQLGLGYSFFERNGNDNIGVAAITGVDATGAPSAFSDVVALNSGLSTWGSTGFTFSSSVFNSGTPGSGSNGEWGRSASVGNQTTAGTFVSFDDFGINVGEAVYGYSIFAGDTTSLISDSSDLVDYTNTTYFPTTTNGADGGADLIGGGLVFAPSSVDVTGLVVPEPTQTSLLLLGGVATLLRRKRA